MRHVRWSVGAGLAVASIALSALVGCSPSGDSAGSDWSTDVFRADLEPGACLGGSYDANGNLTRSFDFAATYFQVVDCSRPHPAQVLGRVAIPSADEWALYGTARGPSQAEADAWLIGVCNAYSVLVANAVNAPAKFGDPVVEPIYGDLVDSQLGFCVLFSGEEGGLTRVVDVDAMTDAALAVRELGAPIPETAVRWSESLGGSGSGGGLTDWFDVTVGSCVLDYAGPDKQAYEIVDCGVDHEAEAVLWVPLAPEWGGVHPGDEAANAYAAQVCEATRVDLVANNDPSLDIVVEHSDAAEQFQFGDGRISICWARLADHGGIVGSFLPAG